MTPRTPQAESNKLFFAANSRISRALFQLAGPRGDDGGGAAQMKTNDAAHPLLSFNSFLIQEHLRRDELGGVEGRDVFSCFQQEFDEKVCKLEAGVGSLRKRTVPSTEEACELAYTALQLIFTMCT